jgi:hypothetical protein
MDKGQSIGRIVKFPGAPGVQRGNAPSNITLVSGILGSGQYLIALPAGGILKVKGEAGLKIGDPVRLLSTSDQPDLSIGKEPGVPWSAFIPLGFGGKNASAKLSVYVEKIAEMGPKEAKPAVYLILECMTDLQTPTQWSIYLKGQSIAIQVYSGEGADAEDAIWPLVREVEENLKKKGFLKTGPTVILKKKFKVPRGFHLNVKG